MAAFAEHLVDDCFMIAPHTTDLLLDPQTGQSDSPTANAFRLAYGESGSDVWAWFDQPQNAYRRSRFSVAMGVSSTLMPEEAILARECLNHSNQVCTYGGRKTLTGSRFQAARRSLTWAEASVQLHLFSTTRSRISILWYRTAPKSSRMLKRLAIMQNTLAWVTDDRDTVLAAEEACFCRNRKGYSAVYVVLVHP